MNDYRYRFLAKVIYAEREEHQISHKKLYDVFRFTFSENRVKSPMLNGFQRQLSETLAIETNSNLNFEIDQIVDINGQKWKIKGIEQTHDKRNVRDKITVLSLER